MTTPTFDPPAERPDARAHTPGPWAVEMAGEAAYVRMFIGKFGLPASATGYAMFAPQPYGRPDEAKANARLIAAAPDLLAALIDAEEEIHHPGSARQAGKDIAEIMRGAIAKATGGARP